MFVSAPNPSSANVFATVTIEWSYTYQGSDLLSVQYPQLRQASQKGKGDYFTNPRHSSKQIIFLMPDG